MKPATDYHLTLRPQPNVDAVRALRAALFPSPTARMATPARKYP
jgi:hypothetical protein